MKSKRNKTIASSVIGTIIESYDTLLYMNVIPIITPLFFVDQNYISLKFLALLSISITLLMRPLGSIYFGYIGDKFGRKNGLYKSIISMTIPTFIIAILPTYAEIYIWAPIILILCRLVQSFSMGGESGGAQTVLFEFASKDTLFKYSSLVYVAILLGGALSTFATFMISINFINWRTAYFIGAFIGIVGLYVRHKTAETPQFIELAAKNSVAKNPIMSLLKENKANLLTAILMCFGIVAPYHLNYIFMVDVLKNVLNVPMSEISTVNITIQILSALSALVTSTIADKMKVRFLMQLSLSIFLFIAYPLMIYNNLNPSIPCSIIIQVLLSLCSGIYAGNFFAIIAYIFPVNQRYTASGFSFSVGVPLFSFVSSVFILGSYKNSFFSYTILLMLVLGLLNYLSIRKCNRILKAL